MTINPLTEPIWHFRSWGCTCMVQMYPSAQHTDDCGVTPIFASVAAKFDLPKAVWGDWFMPTPHMDGIA